MMTTVQTSNVSAASILSQALESKGEGGSVEGARFILGLTIRAEDQTRMLDLLRRNQEGKLTPDEAKQLSAYVEADRILSTLRATAMFTLKQAGQEC